MKENDEKNFEINDEVVLEKKGSNKTILILVGSILLSLFSIFLVLIILTLGYGKIYNGVRINGIDVGGLSKNDAIEVFNEYYSTLANVNISLYNEENEVRFLASDINATFDSEKAYEFAYHLGRDGNFFEKIFSGLSYRFSEHNEDFDVSIDVKKLGKQIANVSREVESQVIEPSYLRSGNKLIVNTGTSGVKIDHITINENVINALNYVKDSSINVEIIKVEPEKVDVDKIQNAIKTRVQNAEYISDTGVLIDQIIGIEIEDLEEARKIAESVTEEGMQFSIPLKITLPETTIDSVLEELFTDTLSTYTTYFNVNEVERSDNVRTAANSINNVILMPGQEFSYNNILGERTTERGYKVAKVYQEGQVVDGMGGGICQVSSTLYNAVVKADLEILERKNHSLPVSYVKLGRDATVVYGVIDFRFKNNQQYPVRIESRVSGGTLTIDICGINTNPSRTVDIETEFIATLDFIEKTIPDASLAMGTSNIIQTGKKGYKVKSYRVTKENGVEIERKVIGTDTYSPIAQIKKVALTETGF